jgi:hypothetical protein
MRWQCVVFMMLAAASRTLSQGGGCTVSIDSLDGKPMDTRSKKPPLVEASGTVTGHASLPAGHHLWVFVRMLSEANWMPQGTRPIQPTNSTWHSDVTYGNYGERGRQFELLVAVVDEATHRNVQQAAANRAAIKGTDLSSTCSEQINVERR